MEASKIITLDFVKGDNILFEIDNGHLTDISP